MAQPTQIVPKWQFPHVMTVINDYTTVTEETTSASDDSVKYLAVFRSPKGIDNVLVKKTDYSDFVNTFGSGSFKEYGQPLLMPMAELKSGNASVWCMRVMPEGARYAHSILSLYYKADVAAKKFRIKFKAKSLSGASAITSKSDLYSKGMMLDGSVQEGDEYIDAEGYTQVPFITFRTAGRGKYGNNCRWRVARNLDYEKDYNIKIYTFESLTTESGLSTNGTYVGSICTSTKYKETTLINDVVDEADAGTVQMDVQVYEDNMENVYDAYVKFLNEVAVANPTLTIEVPDLDEFDPLFGQRVGKYVADPFISFTSELTDDVDKDAPGYDAGNYTTDKIISVDAVTGISLKGGEDGEFDNSDQNARDTAIEKCYVNAFSGTYDKLILSKERIPVTLFLDANYPYNAKRSLVDLALVRFGARVVTDCGVLPSFSEANLTTMESDYAAFASYAVSKETQWYQIKDPITNKKIPVTVTYLWAQKYANHVKENGFHVPFVKTAAQLSGHVKNSLQPPVELYEDELRNRLAEGRFNYFESVSENVFQRGIQNTSQKATSDLLEENNVATLFVLKGILEYDAYQRTYNFSNAEDRERFKDYEKSKFANWVGRIVQSFDIDFEMSEWESQRSILHCYVKIQFRPLSKRTIIEIDINKRDYTA